MTASLYFSPQPTRSARARWAFMEAGLDFEPQAIDVFKGEQQASDYLEINPLGFVPAAVFDGDAIIESAALAFIAGSEGPAGSLVPEPGTKAWRKTLQWVVFAPAELDHWLATLNQQRLFLPPGQRNAEVAAHATEGFARRAKLVVRVLEAGDYLVDDAFSAADVCVGHSLAWAKMHDLLPAGGALQGYLDRLQRRPAFKEVYGGPVQVMPDPHAAAG